MNAIVPFLKLAKFDFGDSLYNIRRMLPGIKLEPLTSSLFIRTAEIATSVACDEFCSDCEIYCSKEISRDGSPLATAYCPKFIGGSIKIPVDELWVHKIPLKQLLTNFALAIKIKPNPKHVGDEHLWYIGDLTPSVGTRFPVYVTTYYYQDALRKILDELCLKHQTVPFVIFTPVDIILDSTLAENIAAKKIRILTTDECVAFDMTGACNLILDRNSIFGELAKSADKKAALAVFGFTLPEDCKWEEVSIHFLTEKSVSITVRKSETERENTEMGFKYDDVQWDLLRTFSKTNGRLPISEYLRKIPGGMQRRKRLNTFLREFFNRPRGDDPIPLSPDKTEYFCRFKIYPVEKSTLFHESKKKK